MKIGFLDGIHVWIIWLDVLFMVIKGYAVIIDGTGGGLVEFFS